MRTRITPNTDTFHSDNLFLSYAVTLASLRRARFVELQVSWTMTLINSYATNPSIWNSNTVSRFTNLFTSLSVEHLGSRILNPFDWGLCQMKDTLKLIKTDLEPVYVNMLNSIWCNCKKLSKNTCCSRLYLFLRSGLKCVAVCTR